MHIRVKLIFPRYLCQNWRDVIKVLQLFVLYISIAREISGTSPHSIMRGSFPKLYRDWIRPDLTLKIDQENNLI